MATFLGCGCPCLPSVRELGVRPHVAQEADDNQTKRIRVECMCVCGVFIVVVACVQAAYMYVSVQSGQRCVCTRGWVVVSMIQSMIPHNLCCEHSELGASILERFLWLRPPRCRCAYLSLTLARWLVRRHTWVRIHTWPLSCLGAVLVQLVAPLWARFASVRLYLCTCSILPRWRKRPRSRQLLPRCWKRPRPLARQRSLPHPVRGPLRHLLLRPFRRRSS